MFVGLRSKGRRSQSVVFLLPKYPPQADPEGIGQEARAYRDPVALALMIGTRTCVTISPTKSSSAGDPQKKAVATMTTQATSNKIDIQGFRFTVRRPQKDSEPVVSPAGSVGSAPRSRTGMPVILTHGGLPISIRAPWTWGGQSRRGMCCAARSPGVSRIDGTPGFPVSSQPACGVPLRRQRGLVSIGRWVAGPSIRGESRLRGDRTPF